jgi:hypothetical protein
MSLSAIRNQISEQSHELLRHGKVAKRVRLGLQEQAALDAVPDIVGAQPAYVTDPQTGTQSFMGLEIVRVGLPSCLEVEGDKQ